MVEERENDMITCIYFGTPYEINITQKIFFEEQIFQRIHIIDIFANSNTWHLKFIFEMNRVWNITSFTVKIFMKQIKKVDYLWLKCWISLQIRLIFMIRNDIYFFCNKLLLEKGVI